LESSDLVVGRLDATVGDEMAQGLDTSETEL
jgi:hypothetical protein